MKEQKAKFTQSLRPLDFFNSNPLFINNGECWRLCKCVLSCLGHIQKQAISAHKNETHQSKQDGAMSYINCFASHSGFLSVNVVD